MKVNSEAIIGAEVWRKSQEGPTTSCDGQFSDQKEKTYTSEDYRFTVNNGAIYAIALKCPEDGKFVIKSLADSKDQNAPEFHGIIDEVEILGFDGKITSAIKNSEGLCIEAEGVESEFPIVIKVKVE